MLVALSVLWLCFFLGSWVLSYMLLWCCFSVPLSCMISLHWVCFGCVDGWVRFDLLCIFVLCFFFLVLFRFHLHLGYSIYVGTTLCWIVLCSGVIDFIHVFFPGFSLLAEFNLATVAEFFTRFQVVYFKFLSPVSCCFIFWCLVVISSLLFPLICNTSILRFFIMLFHFFFWLSSLFRALVQIELSVVLFLMVFYLYLGPNLPLGEA